MTPSTIRPAIPIHKRMMTAHLGISLCLKRERDEITVMNVNVSKPNKSKKAGSFNKVEMLI